jgi:starch synthase
MKVLHLAAEVAPISKIGGLADVAGELPLALAALGHEVTLALPLYSFAALGGVEVLREESLTVRRRGEPVPVRAFIARRSGATYWLVDADVIRRADSVYGSPSLSGEIFGLFSRAVVHLVETWQPDVLHAHDWHTAMTVLWSRTSSRWRGATVLTIHNLAFMGAGSEDGLAGYGEMGPAPEFLPGWSRSLPLPLGIAAADALTTVSPSYAQEIQTPAFGCGLEDVLRARRSELHGILNGIDPQVWDPEADSCLPAPFGQDSLHRRQVGRKALLEELGLDPTDPSPLLGMVTRLDRQKGVDLVLRALETILGLPSRVVLLGTGEAGIADLARKAARDYRGRMAFVERFDAGLARRIFGGADMLLVPSRYEPCGLTQMIAMRYGCIPIVRSTGGLRDSVEAFDDSARTGFSFEEEGSAGLIAALRKAVTAFADPVGWKAIQHRAMSQDFSWKRSAQAYDAVYRRLVHG